MVSITLPTLFFFNIVLASLGLLPLHMHVGWAVVKNPPANAGDTRDMGSIPGPGRSPGVGNDDPLQYSCLENSIDRGDWQATVHEVSKSQTWLNMSTHVLQVVLDFYLKFHLRKHRKANEFCILIFNLPCCYNCLLVSEIFCHPFRYSKLTIMSSVKKDSFTSSFPITKIFFLLVLLII